MARPKSGYHTKDGNRVPGVTTIVVWTTTMRTENASQ